MLLFYRRLACPYDGVRRAAGDQGFYLRNGRRLVSCGYRSGKKRCFCPVAGAAACRTAPDLFDVHAALLARAGADLQGPGAEISRIGEGYYHLRVFGLPAFAGRGYFDILGGRGAGGRGPTPARGTLPGGGPAVQLPLCARLSGAAGDPGRDQAGSGYRRAEDEQELP